MGRGAAADGPGLLHGHAARRAVEPPRGRKTTFDEFAVTTDLPAQPLPVNTVCNASERHTQSPLASSRTTCPLRRVQAGLVGTLGVSAAAISTRSMRFLGVVTNTVGNCHGVWNPDDESSTSIAIALALSQGTAGLPTRPVTPETLVSLPDRYRDQEVLVTGVIFGIEGAYMEVRLPGRAQLRISVEDAPFGSSAKKNPPDGSGLELRASNTLHGAGDFVGRISEFASP
jgi:hypothetical protein